MSQPLDPVQPLAKAQRRLYNTAQRRAHAALDSARKRAKHARALARRAEVRAEAKRLAKLAAMTPEQLRHPKVGKRASADLVVGMAAAGVSKTKIAQALHVTPTTVAAVLTAVPGSRERIAQLREELKATKLTRAHAVEGKLWDRLEHEVGAKGENGTWVGGGDAKDVDGIARALLASEKIQAAAAGEAHASGSSPEPASAMDLTVLVQALLSAPTGGA